MNHKKQLPSFNQPPRLPPEKLVKMLKEKGTTVTLSQAEEILKFLRKMAHIAVSSYLDQHNNNADKNK